MSLTDRPTTTPYHPAPTRTGAGRGYTIAAFICAAVSLLILPIVFGPLGIVLGVVGNRKGDPLGTWAALTAGVLMVAGMVTGYLVVTNA